MEAGHGKGAPDGVGAALKRNADALVNTHDRDVICAADLVDAAKKYHSCSRSERKRCNITRANHSVSCQPSSTNYEATPHYLQRERSCIIQGPELFLFRELSCYDPVTTRFDVNMHESSMTEGTTVSMLPESVSNKDSVLVVPVSLDESLIDRFCVVDYDGRPYPGKIVDVDDNNIEVSAMHCIGDNIFFWPLTPDVIWYEGVKVVTLLNNEPSLVTTRHRAIDKTVWEAIVKKMEL
ncbi:hypothetical protein MAR_002443 [Mya arenaria]|uniref:Uncharacterized protein n=1 Tax=Mya arenaria TaxID=6604 RepID=A0ABY7FEM6_MYAAR|nr:hypothetical protein MAR_002443 [Mya arenaria]